MERTEKMNKIQETLYKSYGQTFVAEKILFQEKTDFQDLVIFQNEIFGNVMMLDGVVQTTEADEMFYHEMIAHVPLFSHSNPKSVLVIGGGDGGTIREVLKSGVERVVLVEIDRFVVELSKKYFPNHSAGAFEDNRLELVIADGCKFVKECKEKFDCIIVDSTDPIGVGEVLFTREFYADCANLLGSGGILITQSGVPFFQNSMKRCFENLQASLPFVRFYLTALPTYAGGFMTLGFSSKTDYRNLPVRTSSLSGLAYYNSEIHQASFVLPEFIKNKLK